METERYIVYRVSDSETGEREEIRGFSSWERALDFMDKASFPTTLDWQKEEITRAGLEIIDADADIDSRAGVS